MLIVYLYFFPEIERLLVSLLGVRDSFFNFKVKFRFFYQLLRSVFDVSACPSSLRASYSRAKQTGLAADVDCRRRSSFDDLLKFSSAPFSAPTATSFFLLLRLFSLGVFPGKSFLPKLARKLGFGHFLSLCLCCWKKKLGSFVRERSNML